jgi:hypothetical protein
VASRLQPRQDSGAVRSSRPRRWGAGLWPSSAGRWLLAAACALTAEARADAQPRTVANLVVGDAAIVVKASSDKHVYIGVATDAHTSTVMVAAPAVDEFVAEAEAIVRLGARRLPAQTLDRPVLEETETGRALSMTRHLERVRGVPIVTYHFFVSDDRLNGYVVSATADETKAMLQALHRAARAANGLKDKS